MISGVPRGPPPHGPVPSPAPPKPRTCGREWLGCFKEVVPAPGVPPIRALPHLVATGPARTLSATACAASCGAHGYPYSGLDRGASQLRCYCGCALNKAAPAVPHATNTSCTAGSTAAMSVYHMPCANATTCGGGPAQLPAGPACSQAEAKQWKFCDTKVPLDDRVQDLVDRITLEEAGALLTARQSPEIPRLGIPAFYWGTNVRHPACVPVLLGRRCNWPSSLLDLLLPGHRRFMAWTGATRLPSRRR